MDLKLEQNGIRIQFKWNGIKDDLESEYNQFKCRIRIGMKWNWNTIQNGMESNMMWNQNME